MDKSTLKKLGLTAGLALGTIILYNYFLRGILQKIPVIGRYIT